MSSGGFLAIQIVLVLFGQVFWRHPNTSEIDGISVVVLPALKKYIQKFYSNISFQKQCPAYCG